MSIRGVLQRSNRVRKLRAEHLQRREDIPSTQAEVKRKASGSCSPGRNRLCSVVVPRFTFAEYRLCYVSV